MTYVIADIHGDYEKYRRMLEIIGFSDRDTLSVLGDVAMADCWALYASKPARSFMQINRRSCYE